MSKICRTFAPKIGKNMKMYKKPITEVTAVDTERMMQDINVSVNGGSGDPNPQAGMPKRGDGID